jgi:hypothetical protein
VLRSEGFTAADLLHQIHEEAAPRLAREDHHFFEGLSIAHEQPATMPLGYFMLLGAENLTKKEEINAKAPSRKDAKRRRRSIPSLFFASLRLCAFALNSGYLLNAGDRIRQNVPTA